MMKIIFIVMLILLTITGCKETQGTYRLICTNDAGVETFRSDFINFSIENNGTWTVFDRGKRGVYHQKPSDYCREVEQKSQ